MSEDKFSKEKLVDKITNFGIEKIDTFNRLVPFPEVPFFAMMEVYSSYLVPVINNLSILGSSYIA